jgi:hypothetical protein
MEITFDRGDHPDHVPHLGHLLLMVSLIVGKVCLTKFLMDGGSMLNVHYAKILKKMKISRSNLCPSGASLFRVVLGQGSHAPWVYLAPCYLW